MKDRDAGLFGILALTFCILIVYIVIFSLRLNSFSDAIIKKYLLVSFSLLLILIMGLLLNSVSKILLIFFPLLFQFNRILIPFSGITSLPSTFQGDGIEIIQCVIIFLFLILLNVKKLLHLFNFNAIKSYLFYICIGLLSTLWAVNKNVSLSFIPNIIMLPLAYYVFSRFFEFNERNVLYITIGLICSALLTTIFVWPSYFGIRWFSSYITSDDSINQATGGIRAGGVISRAGIAMLLAITIPYAYNFGLFYFSRYKRVVNLIGLILLLSLVMTLNRMHFLASCLAICIIIWYGIKEKILKINLFYFFTGAIISVSGIYYVISKNTATLDEIIYRSTYESRFQQYNAALANIKYSFGLGVGMNNYLISPITLQVLGSNNWSLRTGNTVHNDVLRILSEYGVIGLIFFLASFIILFQRKAKTPEAKPIIRGAKIGIAVLLMLGLSSPALNKSIAGIICGMYIAIIKFYSSKTSSGFLKSLQSKYNN